MTIIQEQLSFSGNYRNTVLENVQQTFKQDGIKLKGFNRPQDVIWCQLPDKRYPIALFPNKALRDSALAAIKYAGNNHVILEYSRFFEAENISDKEAMLLLDSKFGNFKLMNHFNKQLQVLKESLMDSDAFATLGSFFKAAIIDRKPFYIENPGYYATVWAKTLYVPKVVLSAGVNRRQFYFYLINKNNEIFFRNNNSSTVE